MTPETSAASIGVDRCYEGRCGEVDYGINCPHCRHRNVTGVFDEGGRHLSSTCDDCGYTVVWGTEK